MALATLGIAKSSAHYHKGSLAMRSLTIRQLQILLAAAEAQSFVRAAERLHVSPAAVSFQIRQIETVSGFTVFERLGKRPVLSEAGRALLGYARTVLRASEDTEAMLEMLRGGTGGAVTIGLISTSKYIVPHLLARFQASHPRVTIHLRDGNRSEIVSALERGEMDVAVMGQPPVDSHLIAVAFATHPSVIVAAPSHPLAQKRRISPSLLGDENFIMREEGSGTRRLAESFVAAAGIALRITMTSSSNETIKQGVMAGMGIALLSRHTVGLELGLGLMRTLAVEGFPLMRNWFIAHRRSMPLLPIHRHLRAFLLEQGQSVVDGLERRYRAAGER
jgi:LysR family transcriptional regulator, low CO2-responsive transcriptional regulator